MSDIAYWSDEYKREVDQLAALLNHLLSLENLNNGNLDQAMKECDDKADRIKNVKKSFGLELRLVKDKTLKAEYDESGKFLDARLNEMNKNLKDVKMRQNKTDLFGGISSQGKNAYSTEGLTNDDLLRDANVIQDKTVESLGRTKILIEESRTVGRATVDQLHRQKDQIRDIENDVDIMETNIRKAEKLVLNFSRRMATDRIIQCFAAVNIVVMLGLILYVVISGKSLTASATQNYPQNDIGTSASGNSPTNSPTSGNLLLFHYSTFSSSSFIRKAASMFLFGNT